MVVVTFSGVPMLGGRFIWGRTACICAHVSVIVGYAGRFRHEELNMGGRLSHTWILLETKTSFTSDAIRLDFPVPSSPHTQMRTDCQESES